MEYRRGNEKGFTVVYALVMLLIVSVGGTALLFMVRKNRSGALDYSTMRVASEAAEAALRACEGQFMNHPDTALAILKKFKQDDHYRWLLNSSVAAACTEVKYDLNTTAGAPKYNAKIVDFDSTTRFLTIEGTGYGGNNGRKKVLALYKLDGIEIVTPPATPAGTYYGLYLGGPIENLNIASNFYCDVYFAMPNGLYTTDMVIQGGSSVFWDNLKTGGSSTSSVLVFSTPVTVKKNAYFQCGVKHGSTLTVDGMAAFEKAFSGFDARMQLKGKSYFNSNNSSPFNKDINMNGNPVYRYSSGIPASKFVNCASGSPIAKTSKMVGLDDSLGMKTTTDAYSLNLPVGSWGSGVSVQSVGGSINGSSFQTWFNGKTTSQKYLGKYLVVNQTSDVSINTSASTFSGKMIWVTNGYALNANSYWPDCDVNSNTFIYANARSTSESASTRLINMGVTNNKKFRGVIYENSYYRTWGTQMYKFGSNTKYYGAIIHTRGRFDLNSGSALNIYCDNNSTDGAIGLTAVQEFADDGILTLPDGGSTGTGGGSGLPELKLVDTKIRPRLLSMQL